MTQETATKNVKNRLKYSTENEKIEELKRKPMHGQFYRALERLSGDEGKSLAWLCSSGTKGETESLAIAAQGQARNTRYHPSNQLTVNAERAVSQKDT